MERLISLAGFCASSLQMHKWSKFIWVAGPRGCGSVWPDVCEYNLRLSCFCSEVLKAALHHVNQRREKHNSDPCFIPLNRPFASIRDQLEFGCVCCSCLSFLPTPKYHLYGGVAETFLRLAWKLSEPQTSLPPRDYGAAVNLISALCALRLSTIVYIQCDVNKDNFSLAMTSL